MKIWNIRRNKMNVGNDGNMPPPIVILSAYSLSEKQQGPNSALKVNKYHISFWKRVDNLKWRTYWFWHSNSLYCCFVQADKMMSNVVNILRRFNLDKIPQNWTSEIWNSQFTDNSPISDYEGKYYNIGYENCNVVFNW